MHRTDVVVATKSPASSRGRAPALRIPERPTESAWRAAWRHVLRRHDRGASDAPARDATPPHRDQPVPFC